MNIHFMKRLYLSVNLCTLIANKNKIENKQTNKQNKQANKNQCFRALGLTNLEQSICCPHQVWISRTKIIINQRPFRIFAFEIALWIIISKINWLIFGDWILYIMYFQMPYIFDVVIMVCNCDNTSHGLFLFFLFFCFFNQGVAILLRRKV